MDFSQDELFDACDRLVAGLLERAGTVEPPVDAVRIAGEHLGIPVEVANADDDERPRPAARRTSAGIALAAHMSPEQQHSICARAIARTLLPPLFRKLDVDPAAENKQATAHFVGLLTARLLVPTKQLRSALRTCRFDLIALKKVFATASWEAIAHRLLDLDEPCVIVVVDDGVVASRRGNAQPVTKKLTAAEEACLARVMEQDLPCDERGGGWTVQGWPVPNRPFRRVILRAVPDDL